MRMRNVRNDPAACMRSRWYLLPFLVALLLGGGCMRVAPPYVGEVTSDLRVCTGSPGSASAYAIDIQEDSVSLRFSWGDNDISDWSSLVGSRDTVSATHAWASAGYYLVKVQARDAQGHTSRWSPGIRTCVLDSALVKWVTQVGEVTEHCPAIGPDGTVYASCYDGLIALTPDGALKWKYSYAEGPRSPVVAPNGSIYIVDDDGWLHALTAGGLCQWCSEEASWQHSPAVGPDGTIYVGGYYSLLALNWDGTEKWRTSMDRLPYGSPVITTNGKVLVIGSYRVCAFRLDGSFAFQVEHPCPEWISAGPNGGFYVTGGSYVYAFDSSGNRKWEAEMRESITNEPTIGLGGQAYVPCEDYGLFCIEPDGETQHLDYLWTLSGIAVDMSGDLVFGSKSTGEPEHCECACLDSTLAWLWSVELGAEVAVSPTIAPDGAVYACSDDGWLYAIKGRAGLASSLWPKFQHDERNSGCAMTTMGGER